LADLPFLNNIFCRKFLGRELKHFGENIPAKTCRKLTFFDFFINRRQSFFKPFLIYPKNLKKPQQKQFNSK
jgi:hypothetical protein